MMILITILSVSAAPVDTSDYIGKDGGSAFDDESVWLNRNITALRLRCGQFFYSIQVRYGDEWGPIHGEDFGSTCDGGGRSVRYDLNATEYIHTIEGRFGAFMDSITFTTNERTLPRCGGSGGSDEKVVSGTRLMYISGRSGCFMDGLQPYWALQ